MDFNFVTNIEQCFILVRDYVPVSMVYYSHIPAAITAILVGFFIYFKTSKTLLSRIILSISISFFLWCAFDIILWTSYDSRMYMFFWSFMILLESLFFVLSLYAVYIFANKKDLSMIVKIILSLLLLPIVLLVGSNINLSHFSIVDCVPIEGILRHDYALPLYAVLFLWLISVVVLRYKKLEKELKREFLLFSIGVASFLLFFMLAEYLVSYLIENGIFAETAGYTFEMYGLFGMPILLSFLAYIIVKFKAFDIKLIGSQALVWALVILIGSQFLYMSQMPVSLLIITGATLIIASVVGMMIVRSVKKEVAQKEQIEKFAVELGKTNEKLKVFDMLKSKFLSLTSHQLRNPISVIKYCTSLFLEGEYGEISDLQKEQIVQMSQRAEDMNDDVDKYLTIAKIDQGGLAYNLAKLDLTELIKKMIEGQKIIAQNKGLSLSFENNGQSQYFVNGDKIQLKQVIQILIDNAIKYTPKGWVKVDLSKNKGNGKIRLAISDSGRGIKPEIIPTLFKEFSRGDVGKDHPDGSGIGLYSAREIIEKGHNGKIWVESEGDGKGSTFIIELPVNL